MKVLATDRTQFAEIDGVQYKKFVVTVDETGEETLTYTRAYKEALRLFQARFSLEKCGIESQTIERTLDGYQGADAPANIAKLRIFLNGFSQKHKTTNLYLWSLWNSTQKSTTAKILAKEIFLQGYTVRFITMSELVLALKEETYLPEKYAALVEDCREVDFLVIDDSFDSKKMTLYKSGYQLSFLDTFLRTRMEMYRRSTCFTSNIDPALISDPFGPSIQALVERSVRVMEFNDKWARLELDNFWGE